MKWLIRWLYKRKIYGMSKLAEIFKKSIDEIYDILEEGE